MPSGGLGNLGLTCAINALIQCITHTSSLRSFFINNTFNESTLAYQFKDVIQLLYIQQATVAPKALLHRLYSLFPNSFHHGEQHDICELWMLISDKIAEEVGQNIPPPPKTLEEDPNNLENKLHHVLYQCNNKTTSQWIETIQGIQISILQCKNNACLEQYYNPELFTTITVDIPTDKPTDLAELLLDFYKIEEMDGWKCDKCTQCLGAKKQSKLLKLPKVLIIVIKRFLMTEDGSFKKIHNGVNISNDLEFTFDNKTHKYKLNGYGNHLGSYHGGHYTASVCNTENEVNKWLYYDDTHYSELRDIDFISNKEAYILFYEKI
jgi:ubiquitin C-terminal hydrolase